MNQLPCGIDFGTSNSSAGYMQFGSQTPRTTSLIPSIVCFQEGKVLVGTSVKENFNRLREATENTVVRSVKRHFLDPNWSVVLPSGKLLSADEVAGEILKEVQTEIRRSVGFPIERAVLTVPLKFSAQERRLLRKAAEHADVDVLSFVHEPFAALISAIAHRKDGAYLLLDWGGGTLDVTLAKKDAHLVFELAHLGLDRAGDDVDAALGEYILQQSGLPLLAELPSLSRDKLLVACEKAKIELSEHAEATIAIPVFLKDKPLLQTITRANFDRVCDPIVGQVMETLLKVVDSAQIEDYSLASIFLAGGSVQIPLLKRRLEERFGGRLELLDRPQQRIAEGAAIAAHFALEPLLAKPIAVQLSDPSVKEARFLPLLERGQILSDNLRVATELRILREDGARNPGILRLYEGNAEPSWSSRFERQVGEATIPIEAENLPKHFQDTVRLECLYMGHDGELVVLADARSRKLQQQAVYLSDICYGVDLSRYEEQSGS